MSSASPQAERIAALLAIDPEGLGGVWMRARHGPAREVLAQTFSVLPGRHGRIMPEAGDDALFGGIDLSQSLIAGAVVHHAGLLERSEILWLTRSEQMPVRLAARIAGAMEDGTARVFILSDESAEADELPPPALLERLAFFVTEEMVVEAQDHAPFDPEVAVTARGRLGRVAVSEEMLGLAVRTAAALGCNGTRPALFVIHAAKAIAALEGREAVAEEDLSEAVQFVLAHRIRTFAEDTPAEPQPQIENRDDGPSENRDMSEVDALTEVVVEVAKTALPDGLLHALAMRDKRGSGSGQGAHRTTHLRGRPLPSRPGLPDGRARLDLLATLQAAAPWQRLRGARGGRLAIRKSDLRIRRYRERSERMLIFLVDASGSAAMARLAEAKGAAEMLLAEAYRSRDHVGVISFRGESAESILEPTKSLVRAKRMLGALPGGGATPLAAALQAGVDQAESARRRGLTPYIILMTDGRANRALDGQTNRDAARADALRMARHLGILEVACLVVDSGVRPSQELAEIAGALNARTIRLPKGRIQEAAHDLIAALEQ